VITQENADSEEIETIAGENYFVELKPAMEMMAARAFVERVGQERRRQLIFYRKRGELLITD
jgi:hypothetical protein